MLNYPVIYFLIAMGSAGLAFSGVATGSVETVRALFVIFLVASLISALVPRRMARSSRDHDSVGDADEMESA